MTHRGARATIARCREIGAATSGPLGNAHPGSAGLGRASATPEGQNPQGSAARTRSMVHSFAKKAPKTSSMVVSSSFNRRYIVTDSTGQRVSDAVSDALLMESFDNGGHAVFDV